uniref:PLAC8 family protein n=1 Tax=Oryza nivara TaxID=4536 RepID=A0A0E0I278_ORYNI
MAAEAREEEEASTAARSRQESEGEEEEVMAVLDFDMLCASVALAAERRKDSAAAAAATVEAGGGGGGGGGGGVQRMWEGDVVLDCLEDRRIALEAACCPCYRFGKNMRRANLGSCFLQGTDSSLDDCVLHLICPCCTLCQEARTLEINNVQCGVWHGRGDTICLGSNGEGNKAFAALHKSSFVPIKSPELCGMDRTSNGANEHEPLVPSDLPEQ